jgi:hypothetical protein
MFQRISDEDTRPLLENIVWYLMVQYGRPKPLAVDLVYRYYTHPTFVDDDFIHHYGAARIATHIYRVIYLGETAQGCNLVE